MNSELTDWQAERKQHWEETLLPLLREGLTYAEAGQRLGVTRQRVQQVIAKYGFESNPRGRRQGSVPGQRGARADGWALNPYSRWTQGALAVVLYVYNARKQHGIVNMYRLARDLATAIDFRSDSIYRVLMAYRHLDQEAAGQPKSYKYSQRSRLLEDLWRRYANDTEQLRELALEYLQENPVPPDRPQQQWPHRWTWDEQLLVVDAYLRVRFERKGLRKAAARELAALFNTAETAVYARFKTCQNLDPEMRARGVRGLSKHSQLERDAWAWYSEHGADALASEAALAKQRLRSRS